MSHLKISSGSRKWKLKPGKPPAPPPPPPPKEKNFLNNLPLKISFEKH